VQASSEAVQTKIGRLSLREREILQQLISGKNVKQIGLQLGTSPNTVRNQRGSILEKMEAASMADLVRMVLAAG
jgi:FixJ family two-component response regulator